VGALLAIATVLIAALADVHVISLAFIFGHWGFLLSPVLISLSATVLAFVIGFLAAIPMGLVRAFGPRIIKGKGMKAVALAPVYAFVTGYVEAIRGTPVFVQIFIFATVGGVIFRGNPDIPFLSGVLALTLNTTGYQAEVFRAGFQSVGQPQIEAGKAIGMRPTQVFAHVTLPQGVRLITLPLVNEWISLLKASALLAYVAVQELQWAAWYMGNSLSHPIEAFIMVSTVYLAIIIPLSKFVNYWEKKHRIPGLGVIEPTRPRGIRTRPPVPSPEGTLD
jgi:His/Glu/Gln/Arg/opine family amino acid ABC transporter permease subunit